MKHYFTLPALIATIMISSSCEEFLTVRTESSFNEETIFSNPALAENAIMGIYESINYNSFNGRLWAYHGYNNDTERSIGSESGMTESDTHRAYAVYKYDESNDYFGSAYTYAYNAIERVNNCISGLKKYGNVSEESSMAYYLGEALFLRAWLYYELIGLWGNIPARFEPATNETVYLGRSDRDVIWKKLLSDLEEASELLPWPGLGKASTILRPSKAAAKALRARIALTAGGYAYHLYGTNQEACRSSDPELSIAKTYSIARNECLDLMNHEGNGYILEKNVEQIFKDNCSCKFTTGRESLWELPFTYNQRGNWMVAAGVYHRGPGGEGTISAGTDPYTSVYLGGTIGVVPTLLYDFDENDSRRYLSAVPFRWADGVQELTGLKYLTPGKLRAEWKNPSLPKFSANANDGITPIILRYADVLLMYAEAENELNGPTESAKMALRRIRERSIKSSQSEYIEQVSKSRESFFNAIFQERRFEFAGELIRKNDLKRWNLLKTSQDMVKEDMRTLRDRTGKYADVPVYVFWRFKEGSLTEIEWFGMNRGEIAPGIEGDEIKDMDVLRSWMNNTGWSNWAPSGIHKGIPETPTMWVSSSTESGQLSDNYINSQYYSNPDRKADMPLPASVISNSQGSLNNSCLGYNN